MIIVGGEALILGGGLYSEDQRPIRESRAVARTFDFTAYEPRPLPSRFVLTSSRAGPGPSSLGVSVFYANYDIGDGFADTTQEPGSAPGAASAAGRCLLPDAGCRRVRTPKGIRVLIARNRWGVDASAVLGRTLVSVLTVDVGEAAVLAYYDALEPVTPDDIKFTGA